MRSVLGKHFAPKTHKLACTIGIIFTTFVLLTTTEIYSNKMGLQIVQGLFACIAISVLVQLGIATKRKEKYASIIFYPLIFAIITLVYEIVAINLNLYFRHASSFGFSIYVFSQSYILAKKFNKAYTTAERLSEHLKEEVDIQTKEAVEQKNRALVSEKNVSGLLNNMKQAVFAMGEKGTIVPPVSRYTEHIFEGDIVGKNIFDVLYKNIGEESELYSSIKFLIDVCINEDSLQYDTMNDALPREVKRLNHEKKERTLKINYSPLFDSNDICRKIMLVIEDITEVLELEQEVVQEKEKATLKIQRLQEIVSNSKREIKVFFREVSLQLDVAKRSVNELDREEYCRAMHTVKGSARIYNLSSFSEEIHLLENKVEDFKNNNDQKNKMSENYNGLELLINQYLDLFKEVFGRDVDETMMKIEDEFVEVPKDIFFSTMEKTKSLLKKEGLFAIIEELKKIEFDDLKKTLFGLHNSLNNMAQSLNKKINLNISGDEVYLNKKTSLMIKDSLMHIIQNSADHGIEAEGHIKIMIKKIEDDIHLEVSDNGKGIDAEDIHKKALEKGLVKKSTSEHFTKSDKLNLIMLAGFSTKQMATEYSGRGVGMDVVKTNIEKLGGTINIDSTLGEGTLFKIQIPYPEEDSSSPDKEVA
jgi:signal transduction histidine kinase/predicted membrane protein